MGCLLCCMRDVSWTEGSMVRQARTLAGGPGDLRWCLWSWKTDSAAFQDLFYVHVANSKPLPLGPAAELAGECADTQSSWNDNQEDLGRPLCFPMLGRTTPQSFHGDDELAYCQKILPGGGYWSFFIFWTIPPLNPCFFLCRNPSHRESEWQTVTSSRF